MKPMRSSVNPRRAGQYDQERRKGQPFDFAGPIVRAAYETLLKQGWAVAHNTESTLLLENDHRNVRVTVVARLDSALLKKIGRQLAGFSVVLAVEFETPINLSLQAAVIDLCVRAIMARRFQTMSTGSCLLSSSNYCRRGL